MLLNGYSLAKMRFSSNETVHRLTCIYRAIWEREGVLFDLWVANSPSIGLSVTRIAEIVEAVITQHENSG